jgi:OmpA family
MRLPPSALFSPFLANQLLSTLPKVGKPLLEMDGYPEYATTANDLDPADRNRIKELARKIVASHKTSTPIVAFVVVGHADVALRKTAAERPQFEQEVSERRANSVRNVMLNEIMALPSGKVVASTVNFRSVGVGSRFPKNRPTANHSLTESEMKQNRRVEIFTADAFVPLPDPPPPPPPPTPQQVVGIRWRILIKSGSVTTIATPVDLTSATVLLTLEITDLDRKLKATFSSRTTGAALPGGSVSPAFIQTSQITEGKTSDFATSKGVELRDFAGSVSIFQDPGAGISVLTTGGNFNFSFEEMENTKATLTRPRVVPVSAGAGALTLPNFALGLVSKGSVSLKGTPAPVP